MKQIATFIDATAIALRMGLSAKHVQDRVVHLPSFPTGIKLGYRTWRYNEQEVDEWIQKHRAMRSAKSNSPEVNEIHGVST